MARKFVLVDIGVSLDQNTIQVVAAEAAASAFADERQCIADIADRFTPDVVGQIRQGLVGARAIHRNIVKMMASHGHSWKTSDMYFIEVP
ncbi:MAG: hypothetical protein KJ954_14145 [Alphaproteobacteria bacterium]|nr:hypothetical protein [Alphaproteobacteria bacterium]